MGKKGAEQMMKEGHFVLRKCKAGELWSLPFPFFWLLVELKGFEPLAQCLQSKDSTGLNYSPMLMKEEEKEKKYMYCI